mmetsp:Transcript_8389/g.28756  ORF Transcript_8389/g.28756 Transcript_8389/m.28756 type:complete len:402 (-) Transcript_8389:352-1557(-)
MYVHVRGTPHAWCVRQRSFFYRWRSPPHLSKTRTLFFFFWFLSLVVRHVLWRGAELLVALDDLVDGVQEVLLRHDLPPRPDGEHPRLCAHGPDLRARRVWAKPREKLKPDAPLDVHGPRVDVEDLRPGLQVGQPELHLPVQPPGPEQRGVQGVRSVGGHQDLDVAPRVKAVELVHDLKHGPLNLVVSPRPVVEPGASDGVNLVEEDDASLLAPGHLEELSDHPGPLAHVLLHKLRPDHPDEASVGPVGHGPRQQRLARPRGAVAQNALWGIDPELHELLRVEHGKLNDLPHLLDLLLAASHVSIRHVRLLLHGHHRHAGVDLWRKRDLDLVLVSVHTHAHPFLYVRRGNPVPKRHDKLGDLLDVDHVLGVVRVRIYDLRAPRDLQRLLLLHGLLVRHEVPV